MLTKLFKLYYFFTREHYECFFKPWVRKKLVKYKYRNRFLNFIIKFVFRDEPVYVVTKKYCVYVPKKAFRKIADFAGRDMINQMLGEAEHAYPKDNPKYKEIDAEIAELQRQVSVLQNGAHNP